MTSFIPLEQLSPPASPRSTGSTGSRRNSTGSRMHRRTMSKASLSPLPDLRTTIILGLCLALTNLAWSSTLSSRVYLYEQAICRRYWSIHDASKIRLDFSVDEKQCKGNDVQSFVSVILGSDSMLSSLPGILVLATYKKLLPLVGVRNLLIMNSLCSGLGIAFSTSISGDYGFVLFAYIFELLGGSEIVTRTLVFTCVTAYTAPEDLTPTYNYISAALMATWVGGSVIGAMMLTHHVWLLNIFSILSYCAVAVTATYLSSQCGMDDGNSPPALRPVEDGQTVYPRLGSGLSLKALKHEYTSAFRTSLQDSFHVFRNLFNMSPTPRKCIYLYLINYIAVNILVLIPQYSSLVLTWPLAKVNGLMAFQNGVCWLLLVLLPTFRKIFLEPKMSVAMVDLTLVVGFFTANAIGLGGMGVSGSPLLYLVGYTIYNPWAGYDDSLRSFSTLSLAPTETVPDLYVRIALVEVLSTLIGSPLWSFLFSSVLKLHLPLGLPFWVCSTFFATALIGATSMRRKQASM